MKRLLCAVFVVGGLSCLAAPSVEAQALATAKTRVRMVRAFCTTGPCAPAINFESGSALLNRMKQPKPLSRRKVGRIRMVRVQSTPLPSALSTEVTARFVWDTVDPDGDCPVLGSDSVQTLATASLFCKPQGTHATCGGDLLVPVGLIDPRCTDVRLTLHDIKFDVYQFGQVGVEEARVATDGISVLPIAN